MSCKEREQAGKTIPRHVYRKRVGLGHEKQFVSGLSGEEGERGGLGEIGYQTRCPRLLENQSAEIIKRRKDRKGEEKDYAGMVGEGGVGVGKAKGVVVVVVIP